MGFGATFDSTQAFIDEIGGLENAGVDRRGGKCRSGKYRSDNAWKAVRRDSIRYQ